MSITNIILTLVVLVIVAILIKYYIDKNKSTEEEKDIIIDDKTFTVDAMIDFVKRRLDEITKINLYDIGLSEEELKRRKAKKYELRKALKGCTYGDVNCLWHIHSFLESFLILAECFFKERFPSAYLAFRGV